LVLENSSDFCDCDEVQVEFAAEVGFEDRKGLALLLLGHSHHLDSVLFPCTLTVDILVYQLQRTHLRPVQLNECRQFQLFVERNHHKTQWLACFTETLEMEPDGYFCDGEKREGLAHYRYEHLWSGAHDLLLESDAEVIGKHNSQLCDVESDVFEDVVLLVAHAQFQLFVGWS
jgi:hypothetical protein